MPSRVPFAYTFPNDPRGRGLTHICSKFITPALLSAGWDLTTQVREEVRFTKGRIIVRGKLVAQGQAFALPRGKDKRADYIL